MTEHAGVAAANPGKKIQMTNDQGQMTDADYRLNNSTINWGVTGKAMS